MHKNLIHYIDIVSVFCFILIMGHIFASIFLLIGVQEDRNNEKCWISEIKLSN